MTFNSEDNDMKTTLKTYKLKELYAKDGNGQSLRTFQRKKGDYVEVLVQVGQRTQKRYLDRTDSKFYQAVKTLIS
jgi:hypothetical protein